MRDHPYLAETLADIARQISAPGDLRSTLDAIVRSAKDAMPGVDHVGLSRLHRGGRIEIMAGTDQLVWDLDSVQYELQEGPCYEAIRHTPVVVADELQQDHRWPRYIPRAAAHGVRAQMGLRLGVARETTGGLSLYSTEADHIQPDVQHIAELFAAHAALALGRARHEEDLNTVLGTRKVVGQALGILMARYDLGEDRAFQFLVGVCSTRDAELRTIAQEVVVDANFRASRQGVSEGGNPTAWSMWN